MKVWFQFHYGLLLGMGYDPSQRLFLLCIGPLAVGVEFA
jgi:hypothetical protein